MYIKVFIESRYIIYNFKKAENANIKIIKFKSNSGFIFIELHRLFIHRLFAEFVEIVKFTNCLINISFWHCK